MTRAAISGPRQGRPSLRSRFACAGRVDVHDAAQLDEVTRRAARDAEHERLAVRARFL
jgi:hypothetical protein